MTALRPGQSPPPVSRPTRKMFSFRSIRSLQTSITLVMVRLTAFGLVAVLSAAALAPAAGAADDLHARRDALLTRIAEQTDRADQDQIAVVAAEDRERQADADLATARHKLETRAI